LIILQPGKVRYQILALQIFAKFPGRPGPIARSVYTWLNFAQLLIVAHLNPPRHWHGGRLGLI
jgi:hypothetical protein